MTRDFTSQKGHNFYIHLASHPSNTVKPDTTANTHSECRFKTRNEVLPPVPFKQTEKKTSALKVTNLRMLYVIDS